MQFPLIKDGIVVNVVEIDDATMCVSKAEHREMAAKEAADYTNRFNAWRREIVKRRDAISTAHTSHFMATGAAGVILAEARANAGDAAAMLDRVLVANAEVEAWAAKVADMKAQALLEKPRMIRAARWIYPDDHVVGPAGGNIGEQRFQTGPIHAA